MENQEDGFTMSDATETALSGWQPIETAPRDGNDILCWGPAIGHMVVGWDGSREADTAMDFPWATLDGPFYHKDAFIYWMPFPALPGSR